jgi:hypothetical protein
MTAVPTDAVLSCPAGIDFTGAGGRRATNIVRVYAPVYVIGAASGDDLTNNGAQAVFSVLRAGASVHGTPGATTPTGSSVSVVLADPTGVVLPITLTFASVTQAGLSSALPVLGGSLPQASFQVSGTAWDITTTAQ